MTARVEPSPEIWHRDDFPLLCAWRKLYRCVEVGVDRAEWASLFLDRFPQCAEWWGVDPYAPYPEMRFPREADFQMALLRLERHGRKAKLIRLGSGEAARLFAPGSVDFVYLDGAHDHASVAADLAAWWPKLAGRGVLAGHDFDDHPNHEGVRRAVEGFAAARGLTVYLTAVDGYNREECPSWYLYKSGIPGPDWRRC